MEFFSDILTLLCGTSRISMEFSNALEASVREKGKPAGFGLKSSILQGKHLLGRRAVTFFSFN